MSKLGDLEKGPAIARIAGFPGQTDPAPVIRQQLSSMLASKVFIQSERLSKFLRFIVEHAIAGNQHYLKEYVIGSEVYDRKPPYHPSHDSIVRTEARRLRYKLKEYYEATGKEDAVYIYLRPGNYIPLFQCREVLEGDETRTRAAHPVSATRADITTIAVLPFTDISGSPVSSTYALGVPDELAYRLMAVDSYRVIAPISLGPLKMQEHDIAAMMARTGASVAVTGSVQEENNHIRITTTMVDSAGYQVWAKRFDAEAGVNTLFMIEEHIACSLSLGLQSLLGNIEGAEHHHAQERPVFLARQLRC